MKITVDISVGDNWKRLLEKVADEFDSTGVKVGITEYNGDDEDYGSDPEYSGRPELEIPEIATYAFWNEFGAPGANIPARPFLRNTVSARSKYWGEVFCNYAQNRIFVNGTVVNAWKAVGVAAKNDVLATIHEGVPPVNTDSTIRAKTKPALGKNDEGKTVVQGYVTKGTLIDKGNLIKSITFQVIKK